MRGGGRLDGIAVVVLGGCCEVAFSGGREKGGIALLALECEVIERRWSGSNLGLRRGNLRWTEVVVLKEKRIGRFEGFSFFLSVRVD